jgi:hypothetical protein
MSLLRGTFSHTLISTLERLSLDKASVEWAQFDETPFDYLQPGSGRAQTGCLWTSNIPGGSVIYL